MNSEVISSGVFASVFAVSAIALGIYGSLLGVIITGVAFSNYVTRFIVLRGQS